MTYYFADIYGYALFYACIVRWKIDNLNSASSSVAQMIMQVCTYAIVCVENCLFDSR